MKTTFVVFGSLALAAALSRLLPHPPNFTPVGALALFGGAYFSDKRIGLLATISVLMLTDLFLGLHATMVFVYASFAIIAFYGNIFLSKNVHVKTVGIAAVSSAVLFFIITNFGVWATSTELYPKTYEGLMLCYTMAIPFFWNTIAGDLMYCGILFGIYEWFTRSVFVTQKA